MNQVIVDENKDRSKGFEKVLGAGYREGNLLHGNPAGSCINRVMVGIPLTGVVRAEWMIARYGQVIPCNWSQTDALQWLNQFSPIDFTVADARNIIAWHCLNQKFEWLFFIDHDVIMPPGTVVRMNERMIKGDIPIWSGLYFTKSVPSEPLLYRGRGTGYYADWKMGDEVWVDGMPMGCTMIHHSILEAMDKEVPRYDVGGLNVGEIFKTPAKVWYEPEKRTWFTETGTEDLNWCTYILNNDIFKKAGWDAYVDKEFPFLIDTSIFCWHIDFDGVQYPSRDENAEFMVEEEEK